MSTIFCFTSTGNSLYVARKIAEKTGGQVLPMNTGPAVCDDELIGFVYPVYFWKPPRIVDRFISELEITNKDVYLFAVGTYGGAAPGVNGLIDKKLKEKGQRLNYGGYVKLVDNYIPMYNPKDSEKLQREAEEKIKAIADAVCSKENNRIAPATFLNAIFYKGMPGEDSDKYFSVAGNCNGCGICQKICPVKNIAMEDDRPAFLHKCEHCLGCIQNCPALAIDWKGKAKGRERFRKDGVTLDDLVSFNHSETSKTA